jgi:hypothetical protein
MAPTRVSKSEASEIFSSWTRRCPPFCHHLPSEAALPGLLSDATGARAWVVEIARRLRMKCTLSERHAGALTSGQKSCFRRLS